MWFILYSTKFVEAPNNYFGNPENITIIALHNVFFEKEEQKSMRYLYFAWITVGFVLTFLLIYPIFWVLMLRKAWHVYYQPVSSIWAWLWYAWCFLPVKAKWEFTPDKKESYLFCPNHFSFFDIPLLTLTIPTYFAFVGLHELLHVPLFGRLFRTFHIPINRNSMRDRYRTYQDCKKSSEAGKSLVVFPEGGIWADESPTLMPFKDGTFRLAIELQKPIIPVTIPYNWHILSLFKINKMQWHKSVIIFHKPIETKGLTIADVTILKEQTYHIINNTLQNYYKK